MVGFGINGLVRSARRATDALRDGLTERERPGFVEGIRRDLKFVEDLLAQKRLGEADLPAPSRRAVEILRRVSALPPSELPTRPEGTEPGNRLTLRGAEKSLDHFLARFERGGTRADEIDGARARAGASADQMEAACVGAGATIASVTERSRRSYAMFRWLGSGRNLERYVEAVARAVGALPKGLAAAALDVPAVTCVRFEPWPGLWKATRSAALGRWRLSLGFVVGDEADFESLVGVVVNRRAAPDSSHARVHELIHSEDFVATVAEVDQIVAPPQSRARGRAHDLDALYDRLDAAYFRGSVARPRLEWVPTLSRHRFGYFVAMHDVICMNPLLDDPAVPSSVVEFVLYHELLHKKLGSRIESGRRHSHTPEFRAEERLHPHFEEAERVMQTLAGAPTVAASAPSTVRSPMERLAMQPSMPFPATRPLAASARPSRNDPCRCGSGRKYKRCHLARDEAAGVPYS